MNYQELKKIISANPKVVLTTHRSPDGDAIGSILGLYLFLKKMGLTQVTPIIPDPDADFLHWMPSHDELLDYSSNIVHAKSIIADAEVIFLLDFNVTSRLGDMGADVDQNSTATKILIDHHREPDDFPYMLSEVGASSTAELIYVFTREFASEVKLDVDIAACLYTGIVTDTGSFRFNSTSPRTHRIAADFMELGLETDKIHNLVYDTNSYNRLQLMGYTLSNKLQLFPEIEASCMSLSQEELQRFNYKKGDTEGLVNYGLSMKEVKFTAFFREAEDGSVKISFRSKGQFDVNTFARTYYNGGGHLNAAGGRVEKPLDEVVRTFPEIAKSYMKELAK